MVSLSLQFCLILSKLKSRVAHFDHSQHKPLGFLTVYIIKCPLGTFFIPALDSDKFLENCHICYVHAKKIIYSDSYYSNHEL